MKKNNILQINLIIAVLFNITELQGQSTSGFALAPLPNQPAGPGEYLGWTFGVNIPLDIKNEDAQSIYFYTNAGNGTYNNGRMQIYDGNGTAQDGFVGIGDFTSGFRPVSLLHLDGNATSTGEVFRSEAPSGSSTFWRMFRGITQYGVLYNNSGDNDFRLEATQRDFKIHVKGVSTNAALAQRIRVTSGAGLRNSNGSLVSVDNVTETVIERVGLSAPALTSPRAMLNIGNDNGLLTTDPSLGGWRTWMDVGVFSITGTDNLYTGLKVEPISSGDDRYDAVIAWGDNDNRLTCCGPDNLRFIFTRSLKEGNDTLEAQFDGAEIARMIPSGFMGIGNFTVVGSGGGSGIPPARRLEIYDQHFNPNTPADAPQLRLTYTPNADIAQGIWTDFQTIASGHLRINPSDQFSGFNMGAGLDPAWTVEIDADAGTNNHYTGSGGGISGLMFNDLNKNSGIGIDPYGKVLTVDLNGKVVLTDDATTSVTSGLNKCTSGIANSFVPRMDNATTNTLCQSQITDNLTNVGIGFTNPASPTQKLDVNGNVNIPATSSSNEIGYYQNDERMLFAFNSNVHLGFDCASIPNSNSGGPGTNNTYVGAGVSNDGTSTPGGNNTFIGHTTGFFNQGGYANTFIGKNAGYKNTTGNDNIFIGKDAGNSSNTSFTGGVANIVVGAYSGGFSQPIGNNNIFLGSGAGNNTYGNSNIIIGTASYGSGTSSSTTGKNIAIGMPAGINGDHHDAIMIGNNTAANCDDCLILGTVGFGIASNVQMQVGIGYTDPASNGPSGEDFLLYVNGFTDGSPCSGCAGTNSAFFNGNIYSGSTWYPSDSVLKNNIRQVALDSIHEKVNQLNLVSYSFDNVNNPQLNLPTSSQYGLIAEDVENIFPGLVTTLTAPAILDSAGNVLHPPLSFKALNYVGIIPLLLGSIKDQGNSIESLKQQLTQLQDQINNCCEAAESIGGTGARMGVTLENTLAIILDQNVPNPFAEETQINFVIPDDVKNAKIIFYEKSGRVMKIAVIVERGKGTLTVYAHNLSSGIYSYSLVADGKVIDTKKMVCNK